MSELSVRQYLHNDGSGLTWGYDKSEADKVIEAKDAKILALDAEVFKEKHHAKLFFDARNYAEAQLRHQKFKRCLAMAKWCSDVRELMHKLPVTDVDADRIRMKQCKWCRKWHKRWLTLADKYKEGNV